MAKGLGIQTSALLLILFSIVPACGGGDGGSAAPTCDTLDFSAVGGDPVGSWRLVESCITVLKNPYASWCTDASFAISVEDISRIAEFRSDGTLSKSGSYTHVYDADVGVTCLDAVSTTCAEQEISLKGNPDYVSAECIENNARCKCTFKSIDSAESGLLWKVEGIKLFDKNGSSNWDDGDDFMVDGDVFVRRGKTDKIMSYSIYERL